MTTQEQARLVLKKISNMLLEDAVEYLTDTLKQVRKKGELAGMEFVRQNVNEMYELRQLAE